MSGRRPQPVLAAAQVSAVATALAALLVTTLARRGLLLPDELTEPIADFIEVGIVAAVGALGALVAAVRARVKVTPLDDPRDQDGTPLAPAPQSDVAQPPVDEQDDRPVVDIAALRREYNLDDPRES